MKNKFTSRKFILTILSVICGVAISLSQMGGKVALICSIISAVVPALTYIITEGIIDAKAVNLSKEAAQQIITLVKDPDGYFTYSEDTTEGKADDDNK